MIIDILDWFEIVSEFMQKDFKIHLFRNKNFTLEK